MPGARCRACIRRHQPSCSRRARQPHAHVQVRTLANHCYDIKFAPPTIDAIVKRLEFVAHREGVAVDGVALASLVESCGGDVRAAVNTLQMHCMTTKRVSAAEMGARLSSTRKDMILRLDAMSATPKMFDR